MTAPKDPDTRARIVRAAARLLAEAGGGDVSTRAVCAAAGVGAPTLYHHFGDKAGLLDAVAAHGFERYLASKRAQAPTGDPVDDLRQGWDVHVEFGRTHPELYTLMYGTPRHPPIAKEAHAILLGLVEAVARAGRLRVPVGAAAGMIGAAGAGVTLLIISGEGGADLSERTREAVLAAITVPAGEAGEEAVSSAAQRAVALRAALRADPPARLSGPEAALLGEWLDRIAAGGR
ncbi:TetR/AcrR family transcriptional regulator [Actinomadura syzygii]|uniref:TetR/AcrR family transcriptional regulator n=1 Tax=Actinomadura syzygii TaxID=1427538 RepID=A0A5D0U3G0_9ACTN|nr:TetR/AcrR family transcriptional regulator [Actinomadura syzygii]TYC12270.1 TetR/AcrR family transcriptional regulator [Actinomadura syzygii]